jgi:16S rRNA processing protein RimM
MGGKTGSDWRVAVGVVVAPVGLRGEVKVKLLTDFPDHLAQLSEVCLAWSDGREEAARLLGVRFHAGLAVARLEGIASREQAEQLRGCEIRIREDMCWKLGDGEYYFFQIVGLEAVTQKGKSLGKVREVLHTGSNDVYATERFLIPATHTAVASIDVEAGRLVVRDEDQVVAL